jgi:hypothetical protein
MNHSQDLYGQKEEKMSFSKNGKFPTFCAQIGTPFQKRV